MKSYRQFSYKVNNKNRTFRYKYENRMYVFNMLIGDSPVIDYLRGIWQLNILIKCII